MIQFLPAVISAIPSIVKLFNSDDRKEGVKELTSQVLNEASSVLGVDIKSKDELSLMLNQNPDLAIKLKDIEYKHALEIEKLYFQDKTNAREASIKRQQSGDKIVRITGSIIALATIFFAFILDAFILYEAFKNGITELNPIVTLIAGYSSARAIQVLSFYFGDSKVNADNQRKL